MQQPRNKASTGQVGFVAIFEHFSLDSPPGLAGFEFILLPAGDLVNFADLKSRLSWEDTSVDDGYGNVAPVGSYPGGASPYGALDMAGDIAERVNDWYDGTYYSTAPLINSPGSAEGDFRVLRGGSWYGTVANVRSTDRSWYIPEGGTDYTGFRCAQSTVAR